MKDFLLELYSEEIPARMQRQAAEDFLNQLTHRLKSYDTAPELAKSFITPCRLSIYLQNLPEKSQSKTLVKRGPRVGANEVAVAGFARSAGVELKDLKTRQEKKGEFFFVENKDSGRAISDILNEVVPETISTFRWPKSMRWGKDSFRWVRPLRSILAIVYNQFENEILEFGLCDIQASQFSFGHTIMAPERFSVNSFASYQSELLERKVMLDSEEREKTILLQAEELASSNGAILVEDPELLREISGLVEWPYLKIGQIDSIFDFLPQEILVTAMRLHQKYLAAKDKQSGRTTHFIVVSNTETIDDGESMLAGHKLVLKARLEDAVFVWNNDLRRIKQKDGVNSLLVEMEQIEFHSQLGSMADRIRRLNKLSIVLSDHLQINSNEAEEVSNFVKLDLASETVAEFPELQGVVGKYFAQELQIDNAIADACVEHYLPAGPADRVPKKELSVVVGLADRIDQLIGFFGIGEIPTGSKDPYALRRAAIGIIRLCIENDQRIRLRKPLISACEEYIAQSPKGFSKGNINTNEIVGSVMKFIHDRLIVHLQAKGFRHDVVNACKAIKDSDDLALLSFRVQAMNTILKTENGRKLIHGFRRANNILKKEFPKGIIELPEPNLELLKEDSEKKLYAELCKAKFEIKTRIQEEDLPAATGILADVSVYIDRLFEQVRVNSDDPKIRDNRLRLLSAFCEATKLIADLQKIEQ